MSANDGGQAFPFVELYSDGTPCNQNPGMSLRDWFAGMALQGMIASGQNYAVIGMGEPCKEKQFASRAYTFATFMLAAREAK